MNPNFRFSQIIPGRDVVRGTGIIESRRLTRLIDSVTLLAGSACWTASDRDGIRAWFSDFEGWLLTSPNGVMESRSTNNHAVWYDVQVLDFALFVGDIEVAQRVALAAGPLRVASQIGAHGAMSRELERTRSLHYSNFNLQAFVELATLARLVDVDLFTYQSPESGACIRVALDYLAPYMTDRGNWPWPEIGMVDQFRENGQTLARAADAYADGGYRAILDHLSEGQAPLDLLRLKLGFWPD